MAALLGGCVLLVNLVRELVNAGYQANAEWEDFFRQVDHLSRKSEFWTSLEATYGVDCFKALRRSLEVVQAKLEREKKKLQPGGAPKMKRERKVGEAGGNIESRKSKTSFFVTRMAFPAKIRLDIDNIKKLFEEMLKSLKDHEKATALAQKRILQGTPSLEFKRDPRYVRLEMTEVKVRTSLLKPNCKAVLLHGGTGRGKSSLARNLALQIQDKQVSDLLSDAAAQDTASTSSHPTSVVITSTQLHETFDEVAFLNCGPDKDLKTMQLNLRQHLVRWVVEDVSNMDLQRSIEVLLQHRKLLVVLDDVYEKEVPQKMFDLAVRAPNVKFLVTSQSEDIFYGLNIGDNYETPSVSMEGISLPVAREILARHITISDHRSSFQPIPEKIKVCADKIINAVDRNILAIACVGGALDFDSGDDFEDLGKWKKVEQDLHHLLNSGVTTMIHSVKYPRPYFAAIEFSFNSLDDDVKMLLVLTALCRENVPEDIVEYLYKTSRSKAICQAFVQVKRTLKRRTLVTIVEDNWLHIVIWSVHSLLRYFLNNISSNFVSYKKKFLEGLSENNNVAENDNVADNDGGSWSVRSLLRYFPDQIFSHRYTGSFLRGLSKNDNVPEKYIVSAICILYLKDSHDAKNIAGQLKADILINTDSKSAGLKDMKLHIVEVAALLAVQEVQEAWTEEMQNHFRKVFLTYLSAGTMDKEGVVFLLNQCNRCTEDDTMHDEVVKSVVAMVQMLCESYMSEFLSRSHPHSHEEALSARHIGEDIIPPLLRFAVLLQKSCIKIPYKTIEYFLVPLYHLIVLPMPVNPTTNLKKLCDEFDCAELATSVLQRCMEDEGHNTVYLFFVRKILDVQPSCYENASVKDAIERLVNRFPYLVDYVRARLH